MHHKFYADGNGTNTKTTNQKAIKKCREIKSLHIKTQEKHTHTPHICSYKTKAIFSKSMDFLMICVNFTVTHIDTATPVCCTHTKFNIQLWVERRVIRKICVWFTEHTRHVVTWITRFFGLLIRQSPHDFEDNPLIDLNSFKWLHIIMNEFRAGLTSR